MIGPELWPNGGATRRLGLVVLTVLSLLTALALLAHVGASRAAGDWASAVSREATALIRPRADESGATAAARAAEALAGVRGVQEAVALERAEAGVDGTVDDHSLWREDFTAAARGVRDLTLLAVLVAGLLTATAIVLSARQAVESRSGALQALRLAGADAPALTFLAQWHLGRDAALAGAVGAGLALLAGLGLALAPLTGTLGRVFPLILTDPVWLAPWPLVTAVVAVVAARVSIRLWLGRQRGGG
ncbi:MAG: hypothetical protein CL683_11735 [Brevundimonas sp.]|nr:hypothetical protein [Brevundimonas sp.]